MTPTTTGARRPLNDFPPPAVMTPKEFHEALRHAVGVNTIYELLRAGRLRHVRIGNRYLILASEVSGFWEREAAIGAEATAWS